MNGKGLDFYDRLVDELLAQRDRAVRDALPLGHAAGARGRGRLARARDRRRVRRVRRGRRGAPRRPRRPLDHAQRAVGRRVGRPRLGPPRPGPHLRRRRARDGAPPAALARPGGRDPAPRVAEGRGRHHAEPRHAVRGSDDPEDVAAARWVDGLHNRWFLDPIFRGAYPADMLEAWRDIAARGPATATWRRSPRRSTSSASTTTPRRSSPPTRTAAARASSAARTSTAPTWAGRSSPTGCTTCSCGSPATTPRRRST